MTLSIFAGLLLVAAPLVVHGQQSCLRYGGGSCCPDLQPLQLSLRETYEQRLPLFTTFLSSEEGNNVETIDNVCYTFFPVPDDSDTLVMYISTVYCNGQNEVFSFIVSETEPGLRRLGNGLCSFSDTYFADVGSEAEDDCYMRLYNRCPLYGECSSFHGYGIESTVLGLSRFRRPIGISCVNRARNALKNNGLSQTDIYMLPMKLPSQCVFNRVCNAASALQKFCEIVGVAFPTISSCAKNEY